MTRVTINTEYALAWAPMMPPLSLLSLLYLSLELSCYRAARSRLGVGDSDVPFPIPRMQVLLGVSLASIVFAIHVVSAA